MGRYSYVAVGTERAMQETFGSTCHGAGRVQSRSAAKRSARGSDILAELAAKGIAVKVASISGLAEEASSAYKDVAEVMPPASRPKWSKPGPSASSKANSYTFTPSIIQYAVRSVST
jgi:RNA-splicing ligase RtcB